jgi:ABC-type multidrug transport system permease subunit
MYTADMVWWAYTAFLILVILFMLFFAWKVKEKGG